VSVAPSAINLLAAKHGPFYAPQVLTITNTGAGALKVTSLTATRPLWLLGRASTEGGTCGRVPFALAAGRSCSVKVTALTTSNALSGKVSVVTSASATPITVTVTGAAAATSKVTCRKSSDDECDD
jgi:hypothetical protein